MNIIHHPPLVFILSFVGLWISAVIGAVLLRRYRKVEDEVRADYTVILTATLTLLGLIVGFTFSMAVGRYDQRKNYEEAEANAIGTEYVRADLLPADSAATVRTLLGSYLDQRIRAYTAGDDATLRESTSEATALHDKLWAAVRTPAAANPTPVAALAVSGMNDVLNAQGYTQAGDRNRIPPAAWVMLLAIAICSNVLIGWGFQSGKRATALLVIVPFISAVAFMFIADIDTPRHGIIRVQPQNLISLSQSIHGG